jgi:polygalacturonase
VNRRHFLAGCASVSGACALLPEQAQAAAGPTAAPLASFNVRDFGAAGDGVRLDTPSLQASVEAAAKAGGGTVHFPPGTYRSGTLFLKSRVTLHLHPGAVLLGSQDLADYPVTVPALRSYTDSYTERSLIYGENLERIALHGRGLIDGQGAAFKGPYKVRPYLVRIVNCRDVSVRDLTFKDSPMWVQHYLGCEGLLVDGITVRSKVNANNDGLDIDGCSQVRVANCDISSGDDALVLKSTLDRPCRNVVVTNCLLSSDCNAFKLGTESNGGFENILLSNCAIYDTRLAGLALELVDGGRMDGVSLSNVVMRNARGGIFIRLGHRARPYKEGQAPIGPGSLRRVRLSDIQATGLDKTGCSITGLPGQVAEDISLSNVSLSFAGGGTDEEARRSPPEQPEKYPEYSMFGVLPAFGLYCRHVRGLRLTGLSVDAVNPEARPSLVCEEVEDLDLSAWRCAGAPPRQPVIRLRQVKEAFIHNCRSPRGARIFLGVEGAASEQIRLAGNSLVGADKATETGPSVLGNAVSSDAN